MNPRSRPDRHERARLGKPRHFHHADSLSVHPVDVSGAYVPSSSRNARSRPWKERHRPTEVLPPDGSGWLGRLLHPELLDPVAQRPEAHAEELGGGGLGHRAL